MSPISVMISESILSIYDCLFAAALAEEASILIASSIKALSSTTGVVWSCPWMIYVLSKMVAKKNIFYDFII